MLAYVEALKEKMALPDLTTVMNTGLPPPTVTARTTVKEAAKLMKDRRTTAVCVMETPTSSSIGGGPGSAVSGMSGAGGGAPKIAGIFTSKDVVLRVCLVVPDSSSM
jgi:CBS domain-containing protein